MFRGRLHFTQNKQDTVTDRVIKQHGTRRQAMEVVLRLAWLSHEHDFGIALSSERRHNVNPNARLLW